MRMTISKRGAGLLVVWLLWLGYLALSDTGAFWISLVFVPVFGAITWSAIRSRNIVLQVFAVLMFTSHAIGAPFLWLNRSNYGGSGYGSVGTFQFDLNEFFLIYVWVVALYGSLVWITRKWDTLFRSRRKADLRFLHQVQITAIPRTSRSTARFFDALLVAFIVLFMVPLNVYMSTNNIGTLGLLNDPLPFRLTGIMYYTRLYFGPVLLIFLFAKSSRSWMMFALILGYAVMAGLSSASRSVLMMTMFSTGYFAILDRQKAMSAIIFVIGLLGFLFTSASRNYTYSSSVFELEEAFRAAFSYLISGQLTIFDTIGNIANRFYGAQDMILSYQFVREDTWLAMANYFLTGGRADSVVPDLGRDFYDMNLEGTGFGVGIGTMAYLLILSHSNILVMPVAVLALGFLISAGNQLLNHAFARAVAAKLISHGSVSGSLRVTIGMLMGFFLYSSSLNIFYTFIQLTLMLLFMHFLIASSKTAVSYNAQ
jgi:hypothetical protein